MNSSQPVDVDRRFGGIAALYGREGLERLRQARVAVIGVGGVGSWVVEALARSALGHLTLVDLDHVAESNINRQLVALTTTLGMAKVQVLAERIAAINPDCALDLVDDFFTAENADTLLDRGFDAVIDCIDNYREKALLIAGCRRRKILIVTVGGAGGKVDPTKFGVADLSRAEKDRLLARTRKELRQRFGFPRDPGRRFSVPAVYSTEDSILAAPGADHCSIAGHPSHLNCGGLGSATHVTATAGLYAVGVVLKRLAWPEGPPPRAAAPRSSAPGGLAVGMPAPDALRPPDAAGGVQYPPATTRANDIPLHAETP
ncbi:MAG: tRNA threonylcarbamoyladenosine dehydratase [Gammaproteobacteria bacterium]|jgi:tRNA A37 threonylcarbamoyladenosine dehydratase|nr:tRNA threonylcarbamoyladenosine dehydratase [Gammaproteobacteria bacterium]